MELLNKIMDISHSNVEQVEALKKFIKNSNPDISMDNYNNFIAHFKCDTESRIKIMICFVIQSAELYVKKIDEDKIFFDKQNVSEISLTDKEVFKNGDFVGFIRSEHHGGKISKQYLEPFENNILKIGDVLTLQPNAKCKGDKLYGNDLSSLVCRKICLDIINEIEYSVNEIYFTMCSSFESTTAMANKLNPDYILLIDTAEENEEFKISQGCGIVYKDGCAVTISMFKNILEDIATSNKIIHQPYIGRNLKLLETLGISGRGAIAGGVYIPVKHKNSAVQIIDKSDVNNTTKLLKDILNSNLLK